MRATEFITEMRRNPQQNPRENVKEKLKTLAQDTSVFVSYTKLPKLGINPNSSGISTPAGVYAYPLHLIWADIENDLTNVPFPAEPQYMYVFRSTTPIMNVRNFGSKDLKAAIRRLHGISGWFKKIPYSSDEPGAQSFMSSFSTLMEYTKKMALQLQGNTNLNRAGIRNDPKTYAFTWNRLMKKATGYDSFVDPGFGIIDGHEPTQAMFLNPSKLQVIDRIDL